MINKKTASCATVVLFLSTAIVPFAKAARKKEKVPSEAEMQQQMMAKMMEAGSPNEAHARLKPYEGKWTATTRMWMKPGDKVQESMGSSVFSWTLGGRFLRQDFKGDMGGMTFEGIGTTGYDNLRKEYVNTWMDSMSTGMSQAVGQYDEQSKAIKDQGDFACPMTGEKHRWYRSELKLPENDTFTYTMYSKDEKGDEFKSMEIIYKRAQ